MERVCPGGVGLDNAAMVRQALGTCRHLLMTQDGQGYRLLGTWTVLHQDFPEPPSGVMRIAVRGSPLRTNIPARVARSPWRMVS